MLGKWTNSSTRVPSGTYTRPHQQRAPLGPIAHPHNETYVFRVSLQESKSCDDDGALIGSMRYRSVESELLAGSDAPIIGHDVAEWFARISIVGIVVPWLSVDERRKGLVEVEDAKVCNFSKKVGQLGHSIINKCLFRWAVTKVTSLVVVHCSSHEVQRSTMTKMFLKFCTVISSPGPPRD